MTLRQAYREFDVSMDRIVRAARAHGHSVPCREGCIACCYDIAFTTEVELAPVVVAIRRMPTEEQIAVERAIESWEEKIRAVGSDPDLIPADDQPGSVRQTYYAAHAACPLLDVEHGRCRVYEERPIACRGHWLIDEPAEKCGNVDKDPVTQNIANLDHLVVAVRSIYRGLWPTYGLLPRVLQKMLRRSA